MLDLFQFFIIVCETEITGFVFNLRKTVLIVIMEDNDIRLIVLSVIVNYVVESFAFPVPKLLS